jgi:membrane-bound serine protease (ClpP class)
MIEVIGVLCLCYLLIGLEAIVPGGVLGVLGFLGLFFAAYLAQVEFGGWFAPSLTFLLGGLGALILVFMEFKWLSKSPLGKRLFIDRSIEGGSNNEVATSEVLGKSGKTLTDLHPAGRIQIEQEEFDAVSEDGLVPKGTIVKVISIENFSLKVRVD